MGSEFIRVGKACEIEVGDTIEWAKYDMYRMPRKDGEGVVLEISGRNILVDMLGTTDWLYFPDLEWVRVQQKPHPAK